MIGRHLRPVWAERDICGDWIYHNLGQREGFDASKVWNPDVSIAESLEITARDIAESIAAKGMLAERKLVEASLALSNHLRDKYYSVFDVESCEGVIYRSNHESNERQEVFRACVWDIDKTTAEEIFEFVCERAPFMFKESSSQNDPIHEDVNSELVDFLFSFVDARGDEGE